MASTIETAHPATNGICGTAGEALLSATLSSKNCADLDAVSRWAILLLRRNAGAADIKPANILVQYRTARYIHIQLADFSLSKDGHELRTYVHSNAGRSSTC